MTRAIIVVDVQRDFCEDGSLAVAGGAEVAERISWYLAGEGGGYEVVVATRDLHEDPGAHFAPVGTDPDYVDTWPPHCVAGTAGAAYHPALRLPAGTVHVVKGEHTAAYSGFEGHVDGAATTLQAVLQHAGVDQVDVVGLADSHCVKETSIDATAAGFTTTVLTDLTAGVSPETTEAAIAEMTSRGVRRRLSTGGHAPPPPTGPDRVHPDRFEGAQP